MTDATIKEKAILAQLAATGLEALHYYEGGISVTLLLACTGPLTLTRDGGVIEGGGGLLAVARGIAICSLTDQFFKKEGRFISLGRALKAYRRQSSSKPVTFRWPKEGTQGPLIDAVVMFGKPEGNVGVYKTVYKSCWMPELTEKERALLAKRELRLKHDSNVQDSH